MMISFKKICIHSFVLAATYVGIAAVPELLNYQGRILNDGVAAYGMTNVAFRFFNVPTAGAPLYSETQTVDIVDGFYATSIGISNSTPGALSDIFTNPTVYLEVEIGSTTLTPRERILAVPYALRTDTANNALQAHSVVGGINDADADPTNEMNTAMTFDGAVLSVSDAGGTLMADLSSLDTPTGDSIAISNIPHTISAPGSYYLTRNVTNTTLNADGITIDSDSVTLNLNGYSIMGTSTGDDGIFVLGSQINIRIFNGSVCNWGGDGINALNADFSIFQNLMVSSNSGDGLVTDFNCLIDRCVAFSNGLDGLEGDDGTVIQFCSAGQNGDNGIQTSEGCTIVNCASFDNETDGFDIASGSTISHCTATDNRIFGFDIALGGQAIGCTAYDNNSNGFDMASACILRDCIASLNNGSGVRTFANSYITDCKFHENDIDGIRISSTDCHVEGNNCTDNDQNGICVTSSGSLIIKNRCAGNLTNYSIDASSAYGPIVDVTGAGDISSTPNADHPYANFQY